MGERLAGHVIKVPNGHWSDHTGLLPAIVSGPEGEKERKDSVSEEVDVVVVADHALAEEICEALKHAGIHHVEFWPEHMLLMRLNPRIDKAYPQDQIGPFHVRVREEDLGNAREVLLTAGLQGRADQEATPQETMREVTRTQVRMHAFALQRFFADRHIAVEIWPAKRHSFLGLLETDEAPFRIMVPVNQLATAQELLGEADGDLAIDTARSAPVAQRAPAAASGVSDVSEQRNDDDGK